MAMMCVLQHTKEFTNNSCTKQVVAEGACGTINVMKQICDVVMEGGGVKGIGIVGALQVLDEAGYSFRRVAGTSAGAIAGSLVAAGMPVAKLENLLGTLDYRQFKDEGIIDSIGILGKSLSVIFERGVYEGDFLRNWLAEQLEGLGVRTFADLKVTDGWAAKLPPEQQYKLVVVTADITRGRMVRLPWDYTNFGLDPDKQLVADAVRASMSIPFFYEPVRMGESFLVDGGMLSNFPIGLFDSTPEEPTFGIKLSARAEALESTHDTKMPYDFALALIETMLNAHDMIHLDDICTQRRTMFVDTSGVKATNFDITEAEQKRLFANGQEAARKFLKQWDFADYKSTCGKK